MNEKPNLREGLKTVLGLAADIGSGLLVGSACAVFGAPYVGANLLVKGVLACGKIGLMTAVSDVGKRGMETTVDSVFDTIEGIKEETKEKVIEVDYKEA